MSKTFPIERCFLTVLGEMSRLERPCRIVVTEPSENIVIPAIQKTPVCLILKELLMFLSCEGTSRQKTIEMSVRRVGQRIDVVISDNGNGVPQHSHLFDAFHRSGFGTVRPVDSHLDLAKSTARDIGAIVWIDSVEGSGTIFHIEWDPSSDALLLGLA